MATIRINGVTAEYRQAGSGPDLLLLHSLLTEMSVFERVLPSLTRTHRVTCLNLPGFGASDPVALNSVGDHADHVFRVMDALSLSPNVDVFGNGFGAFVALELALRHGGRMGRLMVADTGPAFPEAAKAPFRGMAERVGAAGIGAILDTAIGRMFPPAFQTAHPEVVAARKAALAPVDASCFARACLALAALDLRPRLADIRNPTLVMCGALDQTTPPALAREVASAIRGAIYREIPGSGHCPMLEQPEVLVSMIGSFTTTSSSSANDYGSSVARLGGYDIHYVDEGHGYPLLLIHGLAGDHSGWEPQIGAWQNRFRVIAPDNRGAGRSSQVDEPISTADMARDMLSLLDHLGIESAHVIGRSMGGAIAQHMALIEPKRVHTLMMCASFARLDPLGRRVLSNMREVLEWTGSWPAHARHSVQNFVSREFFNANPDRVLAIETLIGSEARLQACYVRQNHACLEHDTLDRIAGIASPTLIMAGAHDPICSPTATRWMAERMPTAEMVIFEHSSHFFLMEEPDKFMAVVNDWLERHSPRRSAAAREGDG